MAVDTKNRIWRLGPVLLWMIVIFCFSAQDATASSALSGGIVDGLMEFGERWLCNFFGGALNFPREMVSFAVRKAAHTSVYFVLALLVYRCQNVKSTIFQKNIKTLAICVVYAITDELHQYFVPGRSSEFRDVCIDTVGAALGLLALFMAQYFTKIRAARESKG